MDTVHMEQYTALEAVLYYETEIKPKRVMESYTMLTKEGEITLFDSPLDELVLYRIFLHEEYQRKGILTNLIKHFQEKANYAKIAVCAAERSVENCLRKINYEGRCFVNHGGDLIWARKDPYCGRSCCK